ncbi:MAG: hypothetical protein HY689_09625 [Chloroflexi bacterium]|nr:hypothetical protein [Chloroflexota bacterium]
MTMFHLSLPRAPEPPTAALWSLLRRWGVLALVVLPLGLQVPTACQPAMRTGEDRIFSAVRRMEGVQTAHFTSQGTLTVQEVDTTDRLVARTEFAMDGDAVFPDRQQATVVLTNGAEVQTDMVRIGNELWVKNPQTNQWIMGTVEGLQIQPIDPLQVMALIRTASRDIKDLGDAQVGEVQTRHLQITLDPERTRFLLQQANPELAQNLQSVEGTVDVWIDGEDFVRQFQPDITAHVTNLRTIEGETAQARLHTNFTMFLTDFDQPVTIEPPMTAQQQGATPATEPNPAPTTP